MNNGSLSSFPVAANQNCNCENFMPLNGSNTVFGIPNGIEAALSTTMFLYKYQYAVFLVAVLNQIECKSWLVMLSSSYQDTQPNFGNTKRN